MTRATLDLDKLVRRILLDVSLLRWFSVNGGRRDAVLSAISLALQGACPVEQPICDFLKRHCGGSNG